MWEAKNPNPKNISSPSVVFIFKPRQVLLAEQKKKMTKTELKSSKMQNLDPAKRVNLHHAILRYLERNAFPKTLKRFLSETQIENDEWKASSLDLEDVYCRYIDAFCNADANLKMSKEQESDDKGTSRKDGKIVCVTSEEITKKKNKKRSDGGDGNSVIDQFKAIDSKLPESAKNSGELLVDTIGTVSEVKLKEKKKRRKDLDTPVQTEENKLDVLNKTADASVHKLEIDESSKNSKDKKKKDKSKGNSLVEEGGHRDLSNKQEIIADDNVSEKKSSKKRKRLVSGESEDKSMKINTIEESKRRKTGGIQEVENENLLKGDGVKANELDNVQVDDIHPSTMSTKQINGNLNDNIEMNGGEPGSRRLAKKHRNGSAEPKTINAFQRVKIDEVKFADDKLQDNSYWAKGGAEVGYGAKAQEVLGQVRGRDFRHEKTKKKRGSYRGGQIDLQSHSIKFNYSDEE